MTDATTKALFEKWAPFAMARELTDASPEMLQQSTDAERASRVFEQKATPSHQQQQLLPSTNNDVLQLTATGEYDATASDTISSTNAVSTTTSTSSSVASMVSSGASSSPSNISSAKLDSLAICKTCTGLGIVKVYYNHTIRDKTCTVCDGDGIVGLDDVTSGGNSNNNGGLAASLLSVPHYTMTEKSHTGDDDSVPPPLEDI